MGLQDLKQNLQIERNLLKELFILSSQMRNIYNFYPYEKREQEKKMMTRTMNSLIEQLKIINNSIPEILNSISQYKSIEEKPEFAEKLVKINYSPNPKESISVTIEEKNKDKFLKELTLSHETLRRLRLDKKVVDIKQEFMEFKQASFYARLANKIFQNLSDKAIEKGWFKQLNTDLRKANMPYLLVTYISMAFFSTLLGFVLGLLLFLVLLYLFPGTALYSWLAVPGVAGLTYLAFYFYPMAERASIASSINQEIPFITLHMSAIAGSGIEPSQIFKIIALGEEYPYTKVELKKIINQINVYGYDLITSLKNTARETSSKKLSELLNGMAATISGGSALSDFLDKRAESLMFEYKLDKEKYTKSAETFMDIYISVMIAAPMIMTLLLVLIVVSRIDIGMDLTSLSIVIISIVSLINVIFLVFLQLNQPSY